MLEKTVVPDGGSGPAAFIKAVMAKKELGVRSATLFNDAPKFRAHTLRDFE